MGDARKERAHIRRAVADYMNSEGCSCCQNVESHKLHKARLAELLGVPKYDDGSGYDFYRFSTHAKVTGRTTLATRRAPNDEVNNG